LFADDGGPIGAALLTIHLDLVVTVLQNCFQNQTCVSPNDA